MKKSAIMVKITILVLLVPGIVCAQPRHRWQERSSSMLAGGISLEQLDLSDEQQAIAQKFRQAHEDQMLVLRGRLMSKRLELRSLFRNPQMEAGIIRAKAREVLELEHQARELTIDYQLQIRGILTPEQLRNWCTSSEWCLPHKRSKRH